MTLPLDNNQATPDPRSYQSRCERDAGPRRNGSQTTNSRTFFKTDRFPERAGTFGVGQHGMPRLKSIKHNAPGDDEFSNVLVWKHSIGPIPTEQIAPDESPTKVSSEKCRRPRKSAG